MNVVALPRGEATAVAILEALRWGDTPFCPWCRSAKVYRMSTRGSTRREEFGRLRCRSCKRMFSCRTRSVVQDTRLPVSEWFRFINAIVNGDGNMLSISKRHGINYKSARRLAKRLRLIRRAS